MPHEQRVRTQLLGWNGTVIMVLVIIDFQVLRQRRKLLFASSNARNIK